MGVEYFVTFSMVDNDDSSLWRIKLPLPKDVHENKVSGEESALAINSSINVALPRPNPTHLLPPAKLVFLGFPRSFPLQFIHTHIAYLVLRSKAQFGLLMDAQPLSPCNLKIGQFKRKENITSYALCLSIAFLENDTKMLDALIV